LAILKAYLKTTQIKIFSFTCYYNYQANKLLISLYKAMKIKKVKKVML